MHSFDKLEWDGSGLAVRHIPPRGRVFPQLFPQVIREVLRGQDGSNPAPDFVRQHHFAPAFLHVGQHPPRPTHPNISSLSANVQYYIERPVN